MSRARRKNLGPHGLESRNIKAEDACWSKAEETPSRVKKLNEVLPNQVDSTRR